MNRRAFLRTGASSTAILWAVPSWCTEERPSPPNDSEMLSDAKAAIEQHRKANVAVHVQNARGEPLNNVRVRLEQLDHEFLFGCNLFSFEHCANSDQEQDYRNQFAALFNYCTLGFYWASYERAPGKPGYDYTDRVLEWARNVKITCKGHPLVWDHPAGSPAWLPDDPAEIMRLVRQRVQEIVTRYQGRIDFWDVVNEATHLPQRMNHTKMAAWGAALGPVPYATEPLKIARAANPGATLVVNDYRVDPPFFEILSHLRDHSRFLFDVVGVQSHMHDGVWPLHTVYSICQRYSKLHLPVHFTETTILSGGRERTAEPWGPSTAKAEIAQAEEAANFYTTVFAHPAVRALTWWDFSDYQAWQRAPAGLLRADMSPKPVYQHLQNLIRRDWWTTIELTTNEKGVCECRGFRGLYKASAQEPGKTPSTTQFRVGSANPSQITLRI